MVTGRTYPKYPRVGVGAVVFNDKKILLVQRKSEPKPGLWTLPGGLVELGEEVEQAVAREVFEECGIRIQPKRVVEVLDYIERDVTRQRIKFHYILVDFEAEYLSGAVTPGSDVYDAGWVAREDLADLALADLTRDFLRKHYEM